MLAACNICPILLLKSVYLSVLTVNLVSLYDEKCAAHVFVYRNLFKLDYHYCLLSVKFCTGFVHPSIKNVKEFVF